MRGSRPGNWKILPLAVQRQCRSQAVTKEAVSKAAFGRIWEDIPCSWFLLSPWPSVLSSETNLGQGVCCGTLCRSHAHAAVFLSSHRTAGAAPLLAWNRMLQSPNQFQPAQYQGLGPMGYPQRPEDRMDRGRQVGTQGGCWVHCLLLPGKASFSCGCGEGSAAWEGTPELVLVSLCHHTHGWVASQPCPAPLDL